MHPVELLTSHILPCTDEQAKKSRSPKLILSSASHTATTSMAGNAMNVPSVGCVLLACVLALKPLPQR